MVRLHRASFASGPVQLTGVRTAAALATLLVRESGRSTAPPAPCFPVADRARCAVHHRAELEAAFLRRSGCRSRAADRRPVPPAGGYGAPLGVTAAATKSATRTPAFHTAGSAPAAASADDSATGHTAWNPPRRSDAGAATSATTSAPAPYPDVHPTPGTPATRLHQRTRPRLPSPTPALWPGATPAASSRAARIGRPHSTALRRRSSAACRGPRPAVDAPPGSLAAAALHSA